MKKTLEKIADRWVFFALMLVQCTALLTGLGLYYWMMFRGAHLPEWFSNMPWLSGGALLYTLALYTNEEMTLVRESNNEAYRVELEIENRELKQKIRELQSYID